ncbi:hypothetical protein KXW08_008163, partial [Aspergillus fumigatus]
HLIERCGGFGAALMVDKAVQIEVVPHIASGRHRDRRMLEVLGQPEKLLSFMFGHADVPREVVDPPTDVHVGHRHDLAILRVLDQEDFIASRRGTQRGAQLFEQIDGPHHRRGGNPAFLPPLGMVYRLEQPRHHIGLIHAGLADRA